MTASRATGTLAGPFRALWGSGTTGGLPDGQLIDRITSADAEAIELSFQSLVGRHGPMVFRACQRMLTDSHDAEDAFQATFLVLLRHAHRIRERGSVAGWLHGVAVRIAARARFEAARRRRLERRGVRSVIERDTSADRMDLESLVQEEVARLPEKYRAPIVLCYLEGLTHESAADQLGWPVGTVRGRLARARDVLRARLSRRGVMASVALAVADSLPGVRASTAVPPGLRDATVQTVVQVALGQPAATVASAHAAAWAENTSHLVSLHAWKSAAGLLLLIGALGTGLSLVTAASMVPQQSRAALRPPEEDRTENLREMLQLRGTWTTQQVTTQTINGVNQPPKAFNMIWSIDRDIITTTNEDGFAEHFYRFTLDPDHTPKAIDLKLLNLDVPLRGIYKLEGDTLTICEGLERPKTFAQSPRQFQIILHRKDRAPTQLPTEYPNAKGCYWAIEPMIGLPRVMASGGLNLIIKKDPQDAIVVSVANLAKLEKGEPDREYRPVAFDEKKNRYLFDLDRGGGWSESAGFPDVILAQNQYRLDPERLAFDGVKGLGIEVIPAEVRLAEAEARSARAIEEARGTRIEILPRPKTGEPFPFTLTASDGRALGAPAFKGKVVLIDCWAGWRSPCMGKTKEIKALYERRRGDGLEVIGVNLDKDRGKAEALAKTLALPWPQVFVPGDDRTRRLWADRPEINNPCLLLIDRSGVLRWNGGPEELEQRIAAILDAPGAGK